MEDELEPIRNELVALAYLAWGKDEDIPDDIQEAIDDIMEQINDIIDQFLLMYASSRLRVYCAAASGP